MERVTATVADYLRAVEDGADGLAAFYGQQLDRPCEAEREWVEREDALAVSALSYARQGLRVFPLTPGRKTPLGDRDGCCGGTHGHGCLDATLDLAFVAGWWRNHPTANVGIATGHRVDVIDQDGPAGARSWLAMPEWPAVLGVATTVRPEGGGVHRYVAATGSGNGASLAPGIDYRGQGGYVLAPPSVVAGVRYAWVQPLKMGAVR